jgi:DNA-binding protein Alba
MAIGKKPISSYILKGRDHLDKGENLIIMARGRRTSMAIDVALILEHRYKAKILSSKTKVFTDIMDENKRVSAIEIWVRD